MKQDETSQLRFHWCLAAADEWALESVASAGVFESIMLEPALASPDQVHQAMQRAERLANVRLMIPFRYDSFAPEDFPADASRGSVLWNVACARLPFAPRQGPGSPPGWYRIAEDFLGARPDFGAPLHIFGNSSEAAFLAIKYGDCLWRFPGGREDTYAHALPILHFGKEVGLVAGVVSRPSGDEARAVACSGSPHTPLEWITKTLCRTPEWPVNAPVLVGSYAEIAEAILGWKRLGISQFLFAAADFACEIAHFTSGVLPLVQDKEIAAHV